MRYLQLVALCIVLAEPGCKEIAAREDLDFEEKISLSLCLIEHQIDETILIDEVSRLYILNVQHNSLVVPVRALDKWPSSTVSHLSSLILVVHVHCQEVLRVLCIFLLAGLLDEQLGDGDPGDQL